MQTYLAEKYMSGPKADAILAKTALTKKKKRKAAAPLTSVGYGAMIVDDDGGWGKDNKEDEDDIADAVVASDRSFKKRKAESSKTGAGGSSGWMTIRDGAGPESPPPGEDEQPQVVDEPFKGGLVTSAQLKKVLPQKGKEKKREETEEEREEARLAQETIYRDASGQRIDIKAERAEAARKKREREEQEAKKMQWGKGLVQREDEERRRQQLERESKRDLAVYADDKELNDELKAKDRWSDPAVAFITKKSSKGPKRPEYTGPPPPPNRFGIKPGYRWDGVDRGNGFEKKMFQRLNERKRTGLESYQWSVDDM